MNPITKFFHEMLNPHCPDCIKERLEKLEQEELNREVANVCQSCESLKMQLSIINQQNEKLLNKLVSTNEIKNEVTNEPPRIVQTMKYIPFAVKRQQLEQEAREKALALKNAAKPDSEINKNLKKIETIEKIEKEIGIDNESRAEAINS